MTSHSRQSGGGTLFTEPVLVVNQKARLIETTSEFAVFDQHGRPLGTLVEMTQGLLRKAVRTLKKHEKNPKRRFEIHDIGGSVVLKLAGQAKTDYVVTRADGTPIGEMTRAHLAGCAGFTFTANGRRVGGIEAEAGQNWGFSITDFSGAEVARVTKSFQGRLGGAFAASDNYVVEMHRHVAEPLASMVLAAALTVDKALKTDEAHK